MKLGMAKATRMQNGLRCTYIVAKYFPGGNENTGTGYNDNVKTGTFDEVETCHDVFQNLITFEKRNEAKADMVEKERQNQREEFLHQLKVQFVILFAKSYTGYD